MIFFSGPEETQLEAAKLGFRTRLDDPVRGHGLRKLPGELPMNPAPDRPFVHSHLRQFKYCNRQPSLLEPQMLTCSASCWRVSLLRGSGLFAFGVRLPLMHWRQLMLCTTHYSHLNDVLIPQQDDRPSTLEWRKKLLPALGFELANICSATSSI